MADPAPGHGAPSAHGALSRHTSGVSDHAPIAHPRPASPGGPLSRRTFLAGAGGALLLAGIPGAHALAIEPGRGASRQSRLTRGTTLVHADLHNHTLLSDGDGDPALAFESMRSAGLDVAALTDHATISDNRLGDLLGTVLPPAYSQLGGLTPTSWRYTSALADAADTPGVFTAIRGFEWSAPLLGHVNVWFTEEFTDIVDVGAMRPLYSWLARAPRWGGGADGIAGFNHPGREPRRFENFRYDARVRDQMVSVEMFNRRSDYLFEGWDQQRSSPLVACLNAGWRTGITGVTDEHGTDWGHQEGKGRTGLWVVENTRAGVLEAMRARRFFATRTSGLRFDATATPVAATGTTSGPTPASRSISRAVRMGGVLPMARGEVVFRVDLARDEEWQGRLLHVQVLRPGTEVPRVADVVEIRVGTPARFIVPLDIADGDWVVLRVSDPEEVNDTPGPAGHPCNDLGIAYSSPWWLEPTAG